MELLKLVNQGADTLTLRDSFNGDTIVEPGAERIVPLSVITVHFGNPGALDEGKNKTRTDEYNMKRVLWGFFAGIHPEAAWQGVGKMVPTGEEVGPFMPKFKVYDMEGNRVHTVIEDPKGEHRGAALAASVSGTSDDRFVHARIAELERQLTRMNDLLMARTENLAPTPDNPAPPPPDNAVPETFESDDPADVEAVLAKAMEQAQETSVSQTQAARNKQREEIPQPSKNEKVTRDRPRTARVGRKP